MEWPGSLIDAVAATLDEARDAERKAVVAWLRGWCSDPTCYGPQCVAGREFADDIERAEHRKERTDDPT
jgi:hypothetical protein